jgi:hypothetical protein
MKLEIQKQEHTDILSCGTGHVWISQKVNGEASGIVIIAIQNVDTICQMLQEAKHDASQKRIKCLEMKAAYSARNQNKQ